MTTKDMEVDEAPSDVTTVIPASWWRRQQVSWTRPQPKTSSVEHRTQLGPFLSLLATRDPKDDLVFPALGKVLRHFPQLWQFARPLLTSERPPYARILQNHGENEPPPRKKAKKAKKDLKRPSNEDLLESCIHFLDADLFFHDFWSWSQLHEVLKLQVSPKCMFLASECLGRVFGMTSSQRLKLSKLNKDDFNRFSVEYLDKKSIVVSSNKTLSDVRFPANNLVDIGGISLPKISDNVTNKSDYIELNPDMSKLREAALALSGGRAILLRGPIASGKTKLVEHLVELTGRKEFDNFQRLQITDQTDGRSLLGGYACSRVPGRFIWKSGPLTEAVTKGHWLLIEDIDQAGLDVMATLLPLLESGRLYLPSKGANIVAAPGFQLFFTMKSSLTRQQVAVQGSENLLLAGKVSVIDFERLGEADLATIATAAYPELVAILPKVGLISVTLFYQFSESVCFLLLTALSRPYRPKRREMPDENCLM